MAQLVHSLSGHALPTGSHTTARHGSAIPVVRGKSELYSTYSSSRVYPQAFGQILTEDTIRAGNSGPRLLWAWAWAWS
jgi:hypothetical protein